MAKSPGVLAGLPFVSAVVDEMGCTAKWFLSEGDNLQPIVIVGEVRGRARDVLLVERVLLNCLARASGIATITRQLKSRLEQSGWSGTLAATRKTTPSFRMVEKYAVLVGGGCIHRYDLSSMIMLKDNHISIAGSIERAIKEARTIAGFAYKIEVECRSKEEALEAASTGCDVIMLDNFNSQDIQEVAEYIKNKYPLVLIEVSGGITEDNIINFAKPGIDIISTSSLVQGYKTIDFSMKINTNSKQSDN